MEAILPECPVCLQVYNNEDTIPRVLSCGHSVCQACLPQLPQRFQNTIRCPACNQLVNYSDEKGPSSLPKNIDLLSFITQQNPNPKPNSLKHPSTSSHHEFLPHLWSEEFYLKWKDWVLPTDLISVETSGKDPLTLFRGRVTSSSSSGASRCCFRGGEIVSLLYVGSSFLSDSMFSFSYNYRIVQFLNQLKERARDELYLILRASSLGFRVCKAYGLWMNMEDGSLFLVCETFNGDSLKNLNEVWNGDGLIKDVKHDGDSGWATSSFAMLGMELCEALTSLHSEGLVSGALSSSCFTSDQFGRVFVNPNEVLVLGRRIRKCVAECPASGFQRSDNDSEKETIFNDDLRVQAFLSPELLLKLMHNEGVAKNCNSLEYSVESFSDVWSLACILVSFLLGNSFTEEIFNALYNNLPEICEENCAEILGQYSGWVQRVSSRLEMSLGSEFVSLRCILCGCLEFDPASRPNVLDVWKCIKDVFIKPHVDSLIRVDTLGSMGNTIHCLILGYLSDTFKESGRESQSQDHDLLGNNDGADLHHNRDEKIEKDILEGLRLGRFDSTDVQGHLDCITDLAVGGGFLFSSSFDKTVHVWSLQDFSHVQSFRGHEHRVMGVVFVDADEPLCISCDNGGGIFVWGINKSSGQELLKKWYEQKDWRYSGIHALAVSGAEHVYTGSGDKSIKAWSLQDYTLTFTMTGHKSVVSCLAVCDGVLYSGSWDGTVRLWSTHDHSPLTILGDDTPGNMVSVLSLSVDHHMLAAAHENGCLKLWRNDVLSRSIETQSGAIFALDIKENCLFMGGWSKILDVKELSGDELHIDARSIGSIACSSVITALLYWEGKLFVGFADRIIKVYRCVL